MKRIGSNTTGADNPDTAIIDPPEPTVVFDDLRIHPNSLPSIGNAPLPEIIATSPAKPTAGTSYSFDGVDDEITVADYAELDSTSGKYTISFWMHRSSDSGTMLFRDGYFRIRHYYADLVVSIDDSWDIWVSDVLTLGADNHVVVTVIDNTIRIFVDGVKKKTQSVWGLSLGANASQIIVGNDDNDDYFEGTIDEIQIYDARLYLSHIETLYNSGQGSCSALTSNILHFSDTITNLFSTGNDMVLSGATTSGDPIVACLGGAARTKGVALNAWRAGEDTMQYFTAQNTHGYKEGTPLRFHIHWLILNQAAGNVVWGLELIWLNFHDELGDTTVYKKTITPDMVNRQLIDGIINVQKPDSKISSVLVCRLFREGSSVDDSFPDSVYLIEADFHFEKDSTGSLEEWTK